jgi:hypothetical protein
MTNRAPLHGTVANYCHLQDSKIMVQKKDYKYIVIDQDTFYDLYFELDDVKTALKEDCIEYILYDPDKRIEDYPEWFEEAIEEGWITNEYGTFIFLDINGELAMSPGSVVLRNFMGDLKYMEREDFEKYYEIIGG